MLCPPTHPLLSDKQHCHGVQLMPLGLGRGRGRAGAQGVLGQGRGQQEKWGRGRGTRGSELWHEAPDPRGLQGLGHRADMCGHTRAGEQRGGMGGMGGRGPGIRQ